jgi:hypothetical protein
LCKPECSVCCPFTLIERCRTAALGGHVARCEHAGLADKSTFKHSIAPLPHIDWVVHCKAPFAGPEQVLRYLSRYTHGLALAAVSRAP